MAYDLAAAKFRGRAAQTNFSLTNYEAELQAMDQVQLSANPCSFSTESLCRAIDRGGWDLYCTHHMGTAGDRLEPLTFIPFYVSSTFTV